VYVHVGTSSYSTDKILIATSVDVLFAQNMLTYNEVVDISLADDNAKRKLLDRKLTIVSTSMYSMQYDFIVGMILFECRHSLI